MIASVRKQLERLNPIKETVFLSPMSDGELAALEAAVEVPIPDCVREYLRTVGYRQDLTSYHDATEYEVHYRFDDFVDERKGLKQLFGDKAAKLFPFAGDGAGDFIVAGQGKDCSQLFFADHETKKISELGTFCQWLEKVVDAALKSKRPPNHRKRRYVQFSFQAKTPEPIMAVLNQFAPASLGDWTKEARTPAGVDPSHARLSFGPQELRLGKSEYWTWETPMFSFNYDEAATIPTAGSQIQSLDGAFRAAGLAYKLGDYGIADSEEMEKIEKEEEARQAARAAQSGAERKKPWWRWW